MNPSIQDLLQSRWRAGRLPLIDGVVRASGELRPATYRAMTLNGVRGAAPVLTGAAVCLDVATDWVEVDERAAAVDPAAGLRYSCGEGSAGGDGYVACARVPTGELVWAAVFQASNPFEALRVDGAHVEAVNSHGHRWRISRADATDIAVA